MTASPDIRRSQRVRPFHLAVFVTSWGEPSETFVRREVSAAVAAGHRVTVVSLRTPTEVDPHIAVKKFSGLQVARWAIVAVARHRATTLRHLLHVAHHSSRRNLLKHLSASLVGIAALQEIRDADVAHAHFAWLAATAADAYSTLAGIPMSVFPHAFDVFETDKIDDYLKSKLARAAIVSVESPTMARDLRSRFGTAASVVRVGVPSDWVASEPRSTRSQSAHPHLVSVGMLREKKGHDILLRALANCPTVRATIVGEGPLRGRLEELAHELALHQRVRFVGLQSSSDVRALLDDADLFCLASRVTANGDRDGVPNVLIEALARSVPSISTSISGIPDLLGNGRGVLVSPDDPEMLAGAIASLVANPEEAARIGRRGWTHVRANYVVESNWRLLEDRFITAIAG